MPFCIFRHRLMSNAQLAETCAGLHTMAMLMASAQWCSGDWCMELMENALLVSNATSNCSIEFFQVRVMKLW